MLLTLVKNNLKLLLRDKTGPLMLTLFPVLLILVLSSAFSEFLKSDYTLEPFEVGYSIQADASLTHYLEVLKEEFEDKKIILRQMSLEEGKVALQKEKIAAYIALEDKKYTLYKKEGFSVNTMIFESAIDGAMDLYDSLNLVTELISQYPTIAQGTTLKTEWTSESSTQFIDSTLLLADPIPSSQDYYGIVEIVYIIWFGISSALGIANEERKNGVVTRIALSKANPSTLFLGRFIPTFLALFIQVGVALLASTVLLKINWGNNLLLSYGILLLEILAISAFGTVVTFMIKNSSIITMGMYLLGFVFGFIGGSFQTYMYNFIDDKIAGLSPLYYINRTLVELSTKGSSAYLPTTIMMLIVITVLSLLVGLTFSKVRGYANEPI